MPASAPPQFYTARQAAFLFLRRPADLSPSEQADLAHLPQDEGLPTLYTLTQDFARMVRERTAAPVDGWLSVAASSPFVEVRRFVNGMRRDHAAVHAGLTLMWSQGQVEGNVTLSCLLTISTGFVSSLSFASLRTIGTCASRPRDHEDPTSGRACTIVRRVGHCH